MLKENTRSGENENLGKIHSHKFEREKKMCFLVVGISIEGASLPICQSCEQ